MGKSLEIFFYFPDVTTEVTTKEIGGNDNESSSYMCKW